MFTANFKALQTLAALQLFVLIPLTAKELDLNQELFGSH